MRFSPAVRRSMLCTLALVGGGLGAGCASEDYSYEAAREIRGNATPNLDTLTQRRVDIDNAVAVTFDTNGRLFNEDLGRFMLFDRPSHLTPTPMPH